LDYGVETLIFDLQINYADEVIKYKVCWRIYVHNYLSRK